VRELDASELDCIRENGEALRGAPKGIPDSHGKKQRVCSEIARLDHAAKAERLMRPCAAAHVLAKARDILIVQDHVGQRDIRSTMVYAKLHNPAREKAAGLLRDWRLGSTPKTGRKRPRTPHYPPKRAFELIRKPIRFASEAWRTPQYSYSVAFGQAFSLLKFR